MTRACRVVGCGISTEARGLCKKHYTRLLRHGDTATILRRERRAGTIASTGYLVVRVGAKARGQHVLIAEDALGKRLPDGAVVHHANEDKLDNSNTNLVICPDENYHRLLHRRLRAMNACGNPDWRKCVYCGKHDDPAQMYVRAAGAHHRACANDAKKRRAAMCEEPT